MTQKLYKSLNFTADSRHDHHGEALLCQINRLPNHEKTRIWREKRMNPFFIVD